MLSLPLTQQVSLQNADRGSSASRQNSTGVKKMLTSCHEYCDALDHTLCSTVTVTVTSEDQVQNGGQHRVETGTHKVDKVRQFLKGKLFEL